MIKLDERAIEGAFDAWFDGCGSEREDLATAIEDYLAAVWRPIDDGAKNGMPILLRRDGVVATAVWNDGMWDMWLPMVATIPAPEAWPTHYAPLAALVDLEG